MGWLQKVDSGHEGALTQLEKQQWAFFDATFALLAHIAKADGTVCLGELATFDHFICVALECEPEAQRMATAAFVRARDSGEKFDETAKRFARLFDKAFELRLAMLETLHQMAMADGVMHPEEERILNRAAKLFKIPTATRKAITALYGEKLDPWAVLQCTHDAKKKSIEEHYREVSAKHNPQQLVERGLPPEFVRLAEKRQDLIDRAFNAIDTQG